MNRGAETGWSPAHAGRLGSRNRRRAGPGPCPTCSREQQSTERRGESPAGLLHAPCNPEVREPGHRESRETACVDPVEVREIEIDVDRYSVEGASGSHPKPDGRNLATTYVYTGCALASGSHDCGLAEHVDDGLLERLDNPPHPDPRTVQVEEQIRHELPRPMVGHLPSPIGTNHGNRSGVPHVAATSRPPEREDGRVLQQPQLVGRFEAPRLRVRSHRLHCVAVRHAPQPVDEKRPRMRRRGCPARRLVDVHGVRLHSTGAPPPWLYPNDARSAGNTLRPRSAPIPDYSNIRRT